jgi:hypothetical protein
MPDKWKDTSLGTSQGHVSKRHQVCSQLSVSACLRESLNWPTKWSQKKAPSNQENSKKEGGWFDWVWKMPARKQVLDQNGFMTSDAQPQLLVFLNNTQTSGMARLGIDIQVQACPPSRAPVRHRLWPRPPMPGTGGQVRQMPGGLRRGRQG